MSRTARIRRSAMAGRGRLALLIGVAAIAILGAALLAQTRPRANQQPQKPAASRKADEGTKATEVKPAERKPLSYYTSGVRANLFGTPPPPEAVVKVEPPKPVEPPTPEVIDPFVDYAYTGTIIMGDQALALIENSKTKEGTYVRVGDQLVGGTVTEVTDRSVTITVAGSPRVLHKTEEYRLTPLDKDAAFRTQQQGPGGMPGMPGMPGGIPGMPGAPGMGPGMGFPGMGGMPADFQQRMMQRFQGMSPEQLQEMRTRFMNRSFEGGNRRRRFF